MKKTLRIALSLLLLYSLSSALVHAMPTDNAEFRGSDSLETDMARETEETKTLIKRFSRLTNPHDAYPYKRCMHYIGELGRMPTGSEFYEIVAKVSKESELEPSLVRHFGLHAVITYIKHIEGL